jgi:hypothetical protein
MVHTDVGKTQDLIQNNQSKMGYRTISSLMSNKCKALSSNLSTAKKRVTIKIKKLMSDIHISKKKKKAY